MGRQKYTLTVRKLSGKEDAVFFKIIGGRVLDSYQDVCRMNGQEQQNDLSVYQSENMKYCGISTARILVCGFFIAAALLYAGIWDVSLGCRR